jgi:hypothetical protein
LLLVAVEAVGMVLAVVALVDIERHQALRLPLGLQSQ